MKNNWKMFTSQRIDPTFSLFRGGGGRLILHSYHIDDESTLPSFSSSTHVGVCVWIEREMYLFGLDTARVCASLCTKAKTEGNAWRVDQYCVAFGAVEKRTGRRSFSFLLLASWSIDGKWFHHHHLGIHMTKKNLESFFLIWMPAALDDYMKQVNGGRKKMIFSCRQKGKSGRPRHSHQLFLDRPWLANKKRLVLHHRPS